MRIILRAFFNNRAMNVKFNSPATSKELLKRAFTLVEMIGVLAVLAILAVIIVPNLLHQLDVAASQQEVATLQGFGGALQSSICRNFIFRVRTIGQRISPLRLGRDSMKWPPIRAACRASSLLIRTSRLAPMRPESCLILKIPTVPPFSLSARA